MPLVPDLGLKDVDVLPGGEVAFSINEEMFSETLVHWEVETAVGKRAHRSRECVTACRFAPQPPISGAVCIRSRFWIRGSLFFRGTNFFSQALGQEIRSGNLLSNCGLVVRTHESLVARFTQWTPSPITACSALRVAQRRGLVSTVTGW